MPGGTYFAGYDWTCRNQVSYLYGSACDLKFQGVKCYAWCYQIYASCDILKLYNLGRKHTRIILNLYLFAKLK
jgi:hypothetical protein